MQVSAPPERATTVGRRSSLPLVGGESVVSGSFGAGAAVASSPPLPPRTPRRTSLPRASSEGSFSASSPRRRKLSLVRSEARAPPPPVDRSDRSGNSGNTSGSSAALRRLEDELAVFRILNSAQPTTNNAQTTSDEKSFASLPAPERPSRDALPSSSASAASSPEARTVRSATPSTFSSPQSVVIGDPDTMPSSDAPNHELLSPTAAPTKRPEEDDVSNLTDDPAVSTTFSRVGHAITQSLGLFRSENPSSTMEEDDEDDLEDGEESDFPSSPRPSDSLHGAPRGASGNRESGKRSSCRTSDSTEDSIDFLEDEKKEMTYGRRIALSLMHKTWYNPSIAEQESDDSEEEEAKDDDGPNQYEDYAGRVLEAPPVKHEKPSLEKAWAYFEHMTLPRYILRPKPEGWRKKSWPVRIIRKLSKVNKSLERAEPGESRKPTRMYSPLFTPLNQMGDFGLGVGLYFSTLRALTIITFIAGLINIPNFIFFSSTEYSINGQEELNPLLKGSAICTNQEWVACPTCKPEDFFPFAEDRIALVDNYTASDGLQYNLTFAKKNACNGAKLRSGLINYATLIFIIVATLFMNWYQRKKEVSFDEDEQTAQDYSIKISNPPRDATDPEEWRKFFADKFDGAHVTACTIAVNNDFLVRSLVERREQLQILRNKLPPGTSMDVINLARLAAEEEANRRFFAKLKAKLVPGIPEVFGRLVVLRARVQGLAQREYPATNVFVTFEKEADQRKVLTSLSVGSVSAWRNDKSKVDADHLFRGTTVLHVEEADEPSTVRWQDLNEKLVDRIKQIAMTTVVNMFAVVLVASIVRFCRVMNSLFAAAAISGFNALFPVFAKLLTNVESHASEGNKQASLYVKIAAFRWVNTAIVITIITPFTSTLTEGSDHLLQSIYAIFFAEIVTTNLIQISDPFGHLERHYLAPRAKTQEAMNLKMRGRVYELAERYTNMTKIFFLALWYSAVYPGGFFMCSVALFINYFTDRFSLMRTWRPAPKLDKTISKLSRRYFFSTAIIAMAIVSSYMWSGFPFDNLCEMDETVESVYSEFNGAVTNERGVHDEENVDVGRNDKSYRFCEQDFLRGERGFRFPFIADNQPEGEEWMTDEQVALTTIYGWTSVGVAGFFFAMFAWSFVDQFQSFFISTYLPSGEDQGVNFSEAESMSVYVPQVVSQHFPYPLLACRHDDIGEELYEWEDPDKPYSHYDLTLDAKELLDGSPVTRDATGNVFSKVMHWPPPEEDDDFYDTRDVTEPAS